MQNEINCMNDSRDFQDAESVRSGHSHVASQLASFPPHPVRGGILRRSTGMPSRKDGPPSIWDTWYIGKRFCKYSRVFFSTQRLQISDLHFDKFTTPATFACWKIRFKTEVCTCSQFPTYQTKEAETADSVDDLRFSSSVRGIRMPDFEILDARIASALNKIIHDSHFKRRVIQEEQKAQKQDRFFRGRQIASLIYEYFRVTGANDSVENFSDLFAISLRNDDIQDFVSKRDRIYCQWRKSHLMTSWKDCSN